MGKSRDIDWGAVKEAMDQPMDSSNCELISREINRLTLHAVGVHFHPIYVDYIFDCIIISNNEICIRYKDVPNKSFKFIDSDTIGACRGYR